MNPSIFRAYDIRGVVGVDLTEAVVRGLGEAIGRRVLDHRSRPEDGPADRSHDGRDDGPVSVAIGRDCRTHSERVADWLASGIVAVGVDVRDIGMGPTPGLYHAAGDGHGVMVTGSHNPPEYNGFKIVVAGEALHGDAIQALGRGTANAVDASAGPGATRGSTPLGGRAADDGALVRYVDDIVSGFAPGSLTVVVDAGNGAAGPTALAAYRGLGHEVVELFCEPDGTFPNHHPDPSMPENLLDLQARVVEVGADVGLAFDGDGDRLGVVDDQGQVVASDRVGALLARRILGDRPGATILGEVKCSDVFFDDVRRHGGLAEMGQVGHSLVKAAMRRTGAAFASELSGHMFFADRWYGFDDAVYAGARVLELLGEARGDARGDVREGLGSMLADLPSTCATPELRVDCADERKFDVVAGVLRWFEAEATSLTGGEPPEIVVIDGVRIRVPGGWGLVRASNTQPALVCRVEGDSPARRDEIVGWLVWALRSQGVQADALDAVLDDRAPAEPP